MSMVELPILKDDGTTQIRNVNANMINAFPCVPLNLSVLTNNNTLSDTDCILMIVKMKCDEVRAKLDAARTDE